MNASLSSFSRRSRTLGVAALLALPALSYAQSALYQWDFDGGSAANTGSGPGGAITITNGTTGSVSIGSNNGVTGLAGDGALNLNASTYGNTTAAANGVGVANGNITGLGTLSQVTVTLWMKPDDVFSAAAWDNKFSRLVNLGANTDGGVNTFRVTLHDAGGTFGTRFEVQAGGVGGTGTAQVGVDGAGLSGNDWVFVAVRYDGVATNPYYSSAMDAASSTSNLNLSIFVGSASSAATQFGQTGLNIGFTDDGNDTNNFNVSPGSIDFDGAGSISYAYFGNNPARTRSFDGHIDDIRVYSGLLTDAQINSVRVDGITAIPEPSSYAVIAGALALVGVAARRRRA